MKKRIYKLMSLVLCAVMAASLSLTALAADGAPASAVIKEPEYYGRAALSLLDNSEALLYAYDKIVEGVEAASTKITVYNGVNPFSEDDLNIVFDAYTRDYTQHFWYDYVQYWPTSTGIINEIFPQYTMTGSELLKARAEFDDAVEFMISGIDPNSSDFEKEKILHDRLAAAVTYVETKTNEHNAYGALVEGKAVCDGYAEAYQYLLRKVGIQSFIAFGSSKDTGEGHAWNYVLIGEKYYHVDVTWDDQNNLLFHSYFNINDNLITKDHMVNAFTVNDIDLLPKCNTPDDVIYSMVSGLKLSNASCTVGKIVELLNNSELTARFYITDGVDEFEKWFYENLNKIVYELSQPTIDSYLFTKHGGEVIIRFFKSDSISLSGEISSWDGTDNAIVKLYDGAVSDEEIRADMKFGTPQKALSNIFKTSELSLSKNKYYQTFEFKNIAAGNYKVAFYKPGGHVVDIKSVSVKDSSVTDINADMQKCGDIINDGVFNSLDLSGLRRALLNASEKTQACDADRSGTIDIIDLIRLKKIVSLTV